VPLPGQLIDNAQMKGHVQIQPQRCSDADLKPIFDSITDHQGGEQRKLTKKILLKGIDCKPLTCLNRTTLDFLRINARLPPPC
jgi:hypothetical protein